MLSLLLLWQLLQNFHTQSITHLLIHTWKNISILYTQKNILKIFCVLQVFDIFNPFFDSVKKYSFFPIKILIFHVSLRCQFEYFFASLERVFFVSVLLSSSSLHHHRHTINAVKWKIVLLFDCVLGESVLEEDESFFIFY